MKHAQRRSTNISLPADLVAAAKELGVNISQAAEKGILAELAIQRRERWLAENHGAIQSHNDWVERHGLPLSTYRRF